MNELTNIERFISNIVEPDFTVDTIASELCPDGFYKITRFKIREKIVGKYEPFSISLDVINELRKIPYTMCEGVFPRLCTIDFVYYNQTILGDLNLLKPTDVILGEDITLLGLFCIAHKIWGKSWGRPNLRLRQTEYRKLCQWLFEPTARAESFL